MYEFVAVKKDRGTATSMYLLYEEVHEPGDFDVVLTEDSNSGFEMWMA